MVDIRENYQKLKNRQKFELIRKGRVVLLVSPDSNLKIRYLFGFANVLQKRSLKIHITINIGVACALVNQISNMSKFGYTHDLLFNKPVPGK
jgi:hypothetical protein